MLQQPRRIRRNRERKSLNAAQSDKNMGKNIAGAREWRDAAIVGIFILPLHLSQVWNLSLAAKIHDPEEQYIMTKIIYDEPNLLYYIIFLFLKQWIKKILLLEVQDFTFTMLFVIRQN